jgi:3,4-dihydroxy 2-butanone 4-phosphate synthase/GTP cyclohydrolase II
MNNRQHIRSAIQDLRNGKMIILTDDASRENEADLVMAAAEVTPKAVNFMAAHAKGLICLAAAPHIIERLQLPLMTADNSSHLSTNFTVSIDAKYGIHTGISAADRAKTILDAVKNHASFNDFVIPGHVFPLKANPHGVLQRPGHTEGSVDLARLADLKPAAMICEIMDEDGHMLQGDTLNAFAKKHRLKIVSIQDIIRYRLRYDTSVIQKAAECQLPTKWGQFKLTAFDTLYDQKTHLALIKGTVTAAPILTRIHSACFTGDLLDSLRCDCGSQLHAALEKIAQSSSGILIYLQQEGRGIGLANKLKAYALQDKGMDTVTANEALGFKADLRQYGIAVQILRQSGVKTINLLTNNPKKVQAFQHTDITVNERIALETVPHYNNYHYLNTKKTKLGHHINLISPGEHHANH